MATLPTGANLAADASLSTMIDIEGTPLNSPADTADSPIDTEDMEGNEDKEEPSPAPLKEESLAGPMGNIRGAGQPQQEGGQHSSRGFFESIFQP
jgi:hypothetical protein